MTEINLATLIRGVCHDVGKMKGIEFHLPASWGMQVPGRWEDGTESEQNGGAGGGCQRLFTCRSFARRSAGRRGLAGLDAFVPERNREGAAPDTRRRSLTGQTH